MSTVTEDVASEALGALSDFGLDGFDPSVRGAVAAMQQWVRSTQPQNRLGGLLDRDRYLNPSSPLQKMQTARLALSDDIIGGAADGTEAFALAKVGIRTNDTDETDAWNQWAGRVDLDTVLRTGWRTLFADGQMVLAWLPQRMSFKMRGKTEKGNERRKTFNDMLVPGAISYLPTDRVIPVGTQLFGRERLAYIADQWEAPEFDRIIASRREGMIKAQEYGTYRPDGTFTVTDDDIVERLIVDRYPVRNPAEEQLLHSYGVSDTHNLFLLNPRHVFRHTLTKLAGQPFADVPLEKCFELLDLKRNLRQKDRAHLVGGTSFIILIKQGSDKHPGQPAELAALQAGVRSLAEMPIMVGDQRLGVEIVQVKQDHVVSAEKHDPLDLRLFAAAWGTFLPTGQDSTVDPLKLGRVIATGLENRRKMLRRFFELVLFQPMFDANDQLTERAKLRFHLISLQFDQAFLMALLELREKKEISRDTMLDAVGLSQEEEAQMRITEEEVYDDTFGTIVPHGANPNNDGEAPVEGDPSPQQARRSGGRRGQKGGAAPGTNQGKEPTRLRSKSQIRQAAARGRSLLVREARAAGVPHSGRRNADLAQALIDHFGDALPDEPPSDDIDFGDNDE